MHCLRGLGRVRKGSLIPLPFLRVTAQKTGHIRNFTVVVTDIRAQAYEDLKKAVRELSGDLSARPISKPPVSLVLAQDKSNLSEVDVTELYHLGHTILEGIENELEPNAKRAYQIWSVAAQKGSIEAKYSLAVCLRQGKGVAKNGIEAFRMMDDLAKTHNYGLAHYAAGIMLHSGEGVAQSFERAFHHFKKAVDAGVIPACNNVANAYASGQGVAKDEAQAVQFYECGAEHGDPAAMYTLGTWLYTGRGGLAVDKPRSFKLQLQAAMAGHPHAMYNTACGYLEGADGGKPNVAKAVEWFTRASDRGIVQASANLGSLYWRGLGVRKDLRKAEAVLSRHAAHSNDCAEMLAAVREEAAGSGGSKTT